WMAEIGKRAHVAVSFVGKVKTTLQMIAIIVLLVVEPRPVEPLLVFGYLMFYVAALLTIWSAAQYLQAAWRDLSAAAIGESDTRS
ncbi:MAG: CDP-alcohol phosphatidyltransferase family protein, partial [Gammaproteobacteria bacterium]